jgi:methionine-rich copper-binding protein CopC
MRSGIPSSVKEYLAGMRFRRLVRICLIASILWLPLPSAQAHAQLVFAIPAVGSNLGSLPSKVQVTFDGDLLVIGGSQINVLLVKDSQGMQIDAGDSKISGATISVDIIPVVKTGTFTVSWRVVSSDGHPEASSYQFTIGPSVASAPILSPSFASSPGVKNSETRGIWTAYGTRLMILLAAAVAVGIWIHFERKRRKRG